MVSFTIRKILGWQVFSWDICGGALNINVTDWVLPRTMAFSLDSDFVMVCRTNSCRIVLMFFMAYYTWNDCLSSLFVKVLKIIWKEILKDCKLIFSHLFPMNSSASNQPWWRMVEQSGAECLPDLDSSVTHVVAGDGGTEKAIWAARENKFLVSSSWIEAANYLRRLLEKEFTVPDSTR